MRRETGKRNIVRKFTALLLGLCFLCTSCGGEEATASRMELTKIRGAVDVSDGEGKELKAAENMKLYGGYGLQTEQESHAWINLDSTKLIKMDSVSDVEIRKKGNDLEIFVRSGKLFFNISEPLGEDESLNIRTSTMAVGIRGTSGWVELIDESRMEVSILEGTVQCSVTDPETGETAAAEVSEGEKAELIYTKEGMADITVEELTEEDLPDFALEELAEDEALYERVSEASGPDISDAVREWSDKAAQETGSGETREESDEAATGISGSGEASEDASSSESGADEEFELTEGQQRQLSRFAWVYYAMSDGGNEVNGIAYGGTDDMIWSDVTDAIRAMDITVAEAPVAWDGTRVPVDSLPYDWIHENITEEEVRAFARDGLGHEMAAGYSFSWSMDEYTYVAITDGKLDVTVDMYMNQITGGPAEIVGREGDELILSGSFNTFDMDELTEYKYTMRCVPSGNPDVFGGLQIRSVELEP